MNRTIIAISFSLFFSSMSYNFDKCLACDLDIGRDFLFIRHGQTPWGPQDILEGPKDLKLNENGRHQAEEAYKLVTEHKSIKNPIIYSSSLQRAYETATIFANKLPQETTIKQVEGLKERYYGDYSQANLSSISDYKPIDAESTDTFQRRVRESLNEILKTTHSDNRELIVVSHQKVFEFLTEWLSHTKLKLGQGGVCYFKFNDGTYSAEIYESSSSDSSD